MVILVLNCGSSSIKYQVIDMEQTGSTLLAKGLVERIGLSDGVLTHKPVGRENFELHCAIPDHTTGIRLVLDALTDPAHGVVGSLDEIKAVGHRVAHGGEFFPQSCIVDEDVKRKIRSLFEIAPLHNPANLEGVLSIEKVLPGTPQVTVFDTSFHQTIPAMNYLYALPQDDALLTAVGGVTPLVTFHRGDCTVAPENTLPAFRSAILKGGDRIELDVQMTSDGVVVVTHDSNLKRCTGKNAKVYDLTYAEVAQLDAGRWFSSRFADTRIPTLEQVLQLCRGRIGLNVEIKPSAATPALEAETVRLLREYGFDSSNCVITSQSYETLHKVKALAPEYPTGYILALGVGNYYDLPDADFFSVETTFITSGMVNAVHLRGKTVSAWTIDREKVATHMLELGVDDLITDKPDMVQDLLARNQQVDDSLIDFRDLLNALLHPEQPADSSDAAEETITDAVEDPEEFVDAA